MTLFPASASARTCTRAEQGLKLLIRVPDTFPFRLSEEPGVGGGGGGAPGGGGGGAQDPKSAEADPGNAHGPK